MAAKTDLTWDELNIALGGAAVTLAGGVLTISVNAVTGDTYAALTEEGVLEFMYKLRSACGNAQTTANESLETGEQLASFPPYAFGPLVDEEVSVTQLQTIALRLDTSKAFGINA